MRRAAALVLVTLLAAFQTAETPSRPTAVTPAAAPAATAAQVFAGLERPATQIAKDDNARAAVARRIAELDRRAYRGVTVEVWGGRALLMGAVIKPEQRRKAAQLAAATEGVAGVLNELVLAEDKALDIFAPDPAREQAVRQALGLQGRDGAAVRVVNGVAFLLGAAPSREAANAVKADASEVAGVKWVVAHFKTP
ncbi:MAG TPA: BON domain-containing protein [Magnetospirillum sp.]|nr:BON domain-containing protein [Magnetospirillum sp.]